MEVFYNHAGRIISPPLLMCRITANAILEQLMDIFWTGRRVESFPTGCTSAGRRSSTTGRPLINRR